MKRIVTCILTLAMSVLLLVGCGSAAGTAEPEHTKAPKQTAEPTPEPTPEPCAHDWVDATCAAPKTCSKCGETEGDVSEEHTMSAATHQSPAVCTVCGLVGETLVPDLTAAGIEPNMVLNEPCAYTTIDYFSNPHTVNCTIVEDVPLTDAEADAECGMAPAEGYSFRRIVISTSREDFSYNYYTYTTDFYNNALFESSVRMAPSEPNSLDIMVERFNVIYDGTEYAGCALLRVPGMPNNYSYTYYVRLPIGYDGFCCGAMSFTVDWPDGVPFPEVYEAAGDPDCFAIYRSGCTE